MATLYSEQSDSKFNKWIVISLSVHIFLLAIAFFWSRTPYIKREFYSPVYRVNLVTLDPPAPIRPKKVKPVKIKKKPVSKPAGKQKIKKAPSISKKKVAVKKSTTGLKVRKKAKKKEIVAPANPDDVINKLKRRYEEDIKLENKLDELRAAIASEEKNERSRAKKLSSQTGLLSATSNSGLTKISSKEMDQILKKYYNSLWNKIRKSWVLPGKPENYKGMQGIVSVKISGTGELLEVTIEESSGNSFYDESTVRAVKKSAPFPKLPESQTDGMEIGFRFIPD